ncbi:MAG TPA: NAD(P)H-binding protein [Candidatus Saccharimonadales bacterium]|nr:NAD(P)H-binding protein [Candidatus Saccharimonadales bacterium]
MKKAEKSLKIAIIGASGRLGSAIAREALARGHSVTAISPRASDFDNEHVHGLEEATIAVADLSDPSAVVRVITGHDAVISAIRNKNLGPETHFLRDAAQTLLKVLPQASVSRLIFLGGGASLLDSTGHPASEAPWFPAEFKDDAREHAEALAFLRAADTPVEWSYSSPSVVNFVDGPNTGAYRAEARDTMYPDLNAQSQLTTGSYAAAIVDALESGSFIRQRFAVGP